MNKVHTVRQVNKSKTQVKKWEMENGEKQGNKKLKRRGGGIRQKLANERIHTWI